LRREFIADAVLANDTAFESLRQRLGVDEYCFNAFSEVSDQTIINRNESFDFYRSQSPKRQASWRVSALRTAL
jgi:hypothetical protein